MNFDLFSILAILKLSLCAPCCSQTSLRVPFTFLIQYIVKILFSVVAEKSLHYPEKLSDHNNSKLEPLKNLGQFSRFQSLCISQESWKQIFLLCCDYSDKCQLTWHILEKSRSLGWAWSQRSAPVMYSMDTFTLHRGKERGTWQWWILGPQQFPLVTVQEEDASPPRRIMPDIQKD